MTSCRKRWNWKSRSLHHGDVLMPVGYNAGQYTKFGRCVSVAVKDRPITIVIADVRQTYALRDQFIAPAWIGTTMT